jgi:hypothetical protein
MVNRFSMPISQNFRQLGGPQPTFGQNPPMHLGGLMPPNQGFGGMWGGQPPSAPFGGMWGSQPPTANPGMFGGGQWWGGQPPMGDPVHPQPIFGGNFGGIDLNRMVNPQGADLARKMMGNFGYQR